MQPVAERGGSDQALLRLVRSLPRGEFDFHIAVPGPSPLAEEFAAAGATLHEVPMLRISTSHDAADWLRYVGPDGRAPCCAWRDWRAGCGSTSCTRTRCTPGTGGRRPGSCDVRTWSTRARSWSSRASRCGVERALCRWFAERVIAVSYAVGAQLDPANVVVLDEYLDPAEFAPAHAGVFRARVGLAGDAAVIGAVARLDPLKGLDTLSTPARGSGPIGPTPSSW